MKVIEARNVHQALPQAVTLMKQFGESRSSRNGEVLQAPWPVTTVYRKPLERVPFWLERDVNIAFLVYEALWMLAGRNDVAPLLRYVKRMTEFSDDGKTFHGAYGYRWRNYFRIGDDEFGSSIDQLQTIIDRLKADPLDRRCVLQMWDPVEDLGRISKDLPCNTAATFQRNRSGSLDMVVFNRSNDIVWGAYFANAFHFSVLLEYMANAIGCDVGEYRQISVNWHAYVETFKQIENLPQVASVYTLNDPYQQGRVHPTLMKDDGDQDKIDRLIDRLLDDADTDFSSKRDEPNPAQEPWARAAWAVLKAHHLYRTTEGPDRFDFPVELLDGEDRKNDWISAMRAWVLRREENAFKARQTEGV